MTVRTLVDDAMVQRARHVQGHQRMQGYLIPGIEPPADAAWFYADTEEEVRAMLEAAFTEGDEWQMATDHDGTTEPF